MDPLKADDIARVQRMPLEERLRAALDAANEGIRLRRAALRHQHPAASEEEIDAELRRWLLHDRADD